jgi:hypothetical protein
MLAIAVIVLVAYDPDDPGSQLEDVVGKVIDGDTLYVGPTKIRLQGVAAPELDEPRGPEARDFPTTIALGKRARCDLTGERSFDRQVAVCRIDGQDLGRLIVEAGLARDCPHFSDGRYEPFEVEQSKRLPLPGYCLCKTDRLVRKYRPTFKKIRALGGDSASLADFADKPLESNTPTLRQPLRQAEIAPLKHLRWLG